MKNGAFARTGPSAGRRWLRAGRRGLRAGRRGPRAGRGLSLLEVVMALCVLAVIVSIALERMFVYLEFAEKIAMETQVAIMKRALATRAAGYLVKGDFERLDALGNENPFDWMADVPANYAGVQVNPDVDHLPTRIWYYDPERHELAYRPRLRRFLEGEAEDLAEIRFQAVVRLQRPGSTAPNGRGLQELSEITIKPTRAYRWELAPPL